jgi:glycosyltransferase involved in cell wall biosynthesis
LHAISEVVKEIPKIKLLIIGKGEEENKLKDLAKSLDLTNKIIFIGLRHDVKKLLSLARLFILPSLWEGMPNVLLEAMAAGKAVIATEVGGIPEVVVHGETGILVPPEDSDALAKSIKYLLQDEIKINKMGETGRVQVEKHFTIAKMLERTEILYQKLLKEKSQL